MARDLGSRSATLKLLYEVAVYLMAFSVLVNALIAGQTLYGDWDILVHGIIGNGVFVLAVAAFLIALITKAGRAAIVVTGVIAVLVFAQVGLGYSGRESLDARAWHIPNGVLIMGLSMWAAAQASLSRAR